MSSRRKFSAIKVASPTNNNTSTIKNKFKSIEKIKNDTTEGRAVDISCFDVPSVAPSSLQTTIDDDDYSDITCEDASLPVYCTDNSKSSIFPTNESFRIINISEECDCDDVKQQVDTEGRGNKEIIPNKNEDNTRIIEDIIDNIQNHSSSSSCYFTEKTYTATTTKCYDRPIEHGSLHSHLSHSSSSCNSNNHKKHLPIDNEYAVALYDNDKKVSNNGVKNAANSRVDIQIKHQNLARNTSLIRKVTFSFVEIRQYERTLGDNPACSDGPPLSIGWNYYPEMTLCIPLNKYERLRIPARVEHYQLVISRWQREMILIYELGYTAQDLADNTRYMNKMRHQRTQTVNNLPVAKMEEIVEQARGKMKKILHRRKKKSGKAKEDSDIR